MGGAIVVAKSERLTPGTSINGYQKDQQKDHQKVQEKGIVLYADVPEIKI